MHKQTALSTAISGILFGTTMALSGAVFAQDNEAQVEDDLMVEEIIVTGSRIKRTDNFDTGGQIVSMDRSQIDAMAELNMADVLRASPLNAYGSFNERSGSSAQSNATFDLRGLGSSRTLVLVDGTRIPGSPNLGANAVNLNMLPMAAVERIDVLADGASAVYGSDAVAGVVNISLYKRFEGIEVSARWGDRDNDDGGDRSMSILAGASNDRGSMVFAFEYSKRDAIFDADRDYTAPWIRDDGDGRLDTYNDTDGISYYGRTWELYDPNTGFYSLQAAADCPGNGLPGEGGFTGVMGAAAFGEPNGTLCTFAYAGVSANRAELEKANSYMSGQYEFSDNHEVFVRGFFSKNESFGRYAPPAAGWPSPPADHPHNPFDMGALLDSGAITEDASLYAYYRWTNIGPRDNYVTDTQWDMMGGFRGNFTDNVSYEVYYQRGEYKSDEVGRYYLSYPGLDYVLNNGIDPFSPLGVGAMRATPTQNNFTKQQKLYGQIQMGTGDLWGAGDSILLVGAEYVDTEYQNLYDAASEAGLVGGSAGNSSSGSRDFYSIFGEWLLPVTENSELNLALRFDDYSDFGTNWAPSLSYAINFTDSLSGRIRWGQGFKAPSLANLNGPTTFSAETAFDPVTGTTRQFDTYFNTNPDLEAEESQSLSFGMNWEFIQNHSIDLSYYWVDIDNVIGTPSAQSLLYADAVGQTWPDQGNAVLRLGNNNVTEIQSFASNGNKLEASGIDFQWQSMWDTGWGMWRAGIFWSYNLKYKQTAYYNGPVQDTAGFYLQPKSRAQFTGGWDLGNWGVDLVVDYIGKHSEEDFVDTATGALTTSDENLDSWTTMNLSGRYDAGKYGLVRVGCNNCTNEDPVLDKDGKYESGFPNLYSAIGRVYFIEYKIKFD